ncbi:MAG: cupin domain-containing protein [Alphaproteobacteria bacterium]
MNADDVIRHLDLKPHPEGGDYREICRDLAENGGRGVITSIYYMLRAHERSHWHRVVDAAEVWHFHAGAPLDLPISRDGEKIETHRLGIDFAAGGRPLLVLPPGCWQAAESFGAWILAGCTVAPAFLFDKF